MQNDLYQQQILQGILNAQCPQDVVNLLIEQNNFYKGAIIQSVDTVQFENPFEVVMYMMDQFPYLKTQFQFLKSYLPNFPEPNSADSWGRGYSNAKVEPPMVEGNSQSSFGGQQQPGALGLRDMADASKWAGNYQSADPQQQDQLVSHLRGDGGGFNFDDISQALNNPQFLAQLLSHGKQTSNGQPYNAQQGQMSMVMGDQHGHGDGANLPPGGPNEFGPMRRETGIDFGNVADQSAIDPQISYMIQAMMQQGYHPDQIAQELGMGPTFEGRGNPSQGSSRYPNTSVPSGTDYLGNSTGMGQTGPNIHGHGDGHEGKYPQFPQGSGDMNRYIQEMDQFRNMESSLANQLQQPAQPQPFSSQSDVMDYLAGLHQASAASEGNMPQQDQNTMIMPNMPSHRSFPLSPAQPGGSMWSASGIPEHRMGMGQNLPMNFQGQQDFNNPNERFQQRQPQQNPFSNNGMYKANDMTVYGSELNLNNQYDLNAQHPFSESDFFHALYGRGR